MDLAIQLLTGGVGKASAAEDVPVKTFLAGGRPNPFNPSTTIHFDLAKTADAMLSIYDIAGRLVYKFDREKLQPGRYDRAWTGRNDQGQHVAAGIYLVRLVAGSETFQKKIVLVK